ncbi:two component system response regulator [Pseudomonas chlororaphis]|uniref:two component system response regulator n=1 Tax=Pseudomonas chlororaphis TaxID=587753 RepID=UPI0006A5E086|nr:two component system response regulator [Pseudomonas chlororaphis]AVO60250.1 DNA-binding response regulator [Pseudomonas chlororaphis subsp. piscium]AZC32428.1 Two-component transcriptional response regulator, LuxR family [Pseudomonas chlororaphis subsp. piscium]MBP5075766.1 two component system response regulator [Pseudomonas chlororaphis]QTT87866.1 two component system response regulator [Pseudomonas chlororaphis]UCR83657.1 two component system response regulator [Pseudomonas chlororaphis
MLSYLQTTPAPQRILIVEDHYLLIYGIKILLSAMPGYEVVGEIVDGLNVYAACQELKPDVVLLDLGLPGMDGIDVIRQLKRRRPELTIVVVTADASEHRARDALAAGALAYILKKSSQQVLLAGLQTAIAGQVFLDPALNLAHVTSAPNVGGQGNLTTRERQILKLIAEGDRNRDISEKLSITIKTVETHRLNLMRKLDAHNIADLVNWACRLGIH